MRRFLLALVGTAAALSALLSFKSHTLSVATPPAAIGTPTANEDGRAAAPTAGSTAESAPSSGTPTASATPGGTTGTRTVTGDSADTRWGPVQVQLTITDGRVTAAEAVVYPQENPRDQEINSYAIPELNSEATSAASADIDSVSGATVTSDGYKQSLQSALDRAGL